MPDFKSLQCFTELVQSKGFSATADKLCLTQPRRSEQDHRLRSKAEYGMPLLEASGRREREPRAHRNRPHRLPATPSACWSSGTPSIRKSTAPAK